MEKNFHERLADVTRKVVIEPFALFIDGEERKALDMRWVLVGYLVMVVLITTFLSLISLEESLDDIYPVVWFNWFLHSASAIMVLGITARFCRSLGLNKVIAACCALMVAIPFIALFSMQIDELFNVIDEDQTENQGFLLNWLVEMGEIIPIIALLWGAIVYFLFNKASEFRTGRHDPDQEESRTGPRAAGPGQWPEALDAVSEDKRGELISISSDQHYLQVRTTSGDSYIRGVLKDVIEELTDIEGFSIHRSHWVSVAHISKLATAGGQMYLVMTDGTRLPVSRRRKNQIKNALMKVELA